MNQETEQNGVDALDDYLKLYHEIKVRTGDGQSALVILREVNKDVRMAKISEERARTWGRRIRLGSGKANGRRNGDQDDNTRPASERQLGYLSQLGVDVCPGLSKAQASAMIDETLEKEPEQDWLQPASAENVRLPWYSVDWS